MDQNLAYMYKMMQEARGNLVFNRKTLNEYGAKVDLFPGVEGWFERIRQYGIDKGVMIEHYIISSGLMEMIEGTTVAKAGAFERIYASSFYYDEKGVAVWPAQVVNYTNKTQFLFRIEKGVFNAETQLDNLVKAIIDRTASNEALEAVHYQNKKEYMEEDKKNDEECKRKIDLILSLESSRNFANTHLVIKELSGYENWSNDELEILMSIAVNNTQVFYILNDADVKLFYKKLLGKLTHFSENAMKIKSEIGEE